MQLSGALPAPNKALQDGNRALQNRSRTVPGQASLSVPSLFSAVFFFLLVSCSFWNILNIQTVRLETPPMRHFLMVSSLLSLRLCRCDAYFPVHSVYCVPRKSARASSESHIVLPLPTLEEPPTKPHSLIQYRKSAAHTHTHTHTQAQNQTSLSPGWYTGYAPKDDRRAVTTQYSIRWQYIMLLL